MNKNHPTTAGKVLKQLMFKHDINESQLSHLTGVSKSNISRLKNDPQCNQHHQTPEIALTDSQFFEIFTKKYTEWIKNKSTSPH